MIKTINLLLIVAMIFGIVILSLQRKNYSRFDLLEKTERIIQLSYNTISIKQIDSLTANTNRKFSEIIAESIKIK
jgi:hypothetical protein